MTRIRTAQLIMACLALFFLLPSQKAWGAISITNRPQPNSSSGAMAYYICHRTDSTPPYRLVKINRLNLWARSQHAFHRADANHRYGDVMGITDRDGDSDIDLNDCTYVDSDNDGSPDDRDPCPNDPTNTDPDGDRVCAGADNCPQTRSSDVTDADHDGAGDVCDLDSGQAFVDSVAADFAFNPYLGIETSKRMILIALSEEANSQMYAKAIQVAGCRLGGTLPFARIIQLDCGSSSTISDLKDAIDRLRAFDWVIAATYDAELKSDSLPPPSFRSDWDWLEPDGLVWGMKKIGAPAAWNLKTHIDKREQSNPTNQLPIPVAVIDAGFYDHPDLAGKLTLFGGATYGAYGDGSSDRSNNHGTSVTGIIGANWDNGQYSEGISPFVHVYGTTPDSPPAVGLPHSGFEIVSFGDLLGRYHHVLSLNPFPRLLNLSLGYGWSNRCHNDSSGIGAPFRCDPRSTGRVDDGTSCTPLEVQKMIEDQGKAFGQLIENINKIKPLMVFQSAGNDSGPSLASPDDYCFPVDCSADNADPNLCPERGMDDFPAELSSPMNWAAKHHAGGQHIIVAEALESIDPTNPLITQRASFSNVDSGGVFAPGVDVGAPQGVEDNVNLSLAWDLRPFSGTSAAAPYLTGMAAYLLAIEPTLTNDELRILLSDPAYVMDQNGGSSATSGAPNLLFAAAAIDDKRPQRDPGVLEWLADMDDGSADGFTRQAFIYRDGFYLDNGPFLSDLQGDGHVDMRDFRRLRDTYLMQVHNNMLGTDPANQKLDLNWDGLTDTQTTIRLERFPRAMLGLHAAFLQEDPHLQYSPFIPFEVHLHGVHIFRQGYSRDFDPQRLQAWRPSDLESLLKSSDLHFFAADIDFVNTGLNSAGVQIDITGTNLDAWLNFSNAALLQGLQLGLDQEDEYVLNTPLRGGAEVHWRPLCGNAAGVPNTIRLKGGQDLEPGEDLYVNLYQNMLLNCGTVHKCDGTTLCAPPPPPPPPPAVCGDGSCDAAAGETQLSCSQDCGAPTPCTSDLGCPGGEICEIPPGQSSGACVSPGPSSQVGRYEETTSAPNSPDTQVVATLSNVQMGPNPAVDRNWCLRNPTAPQCADIYLGYTYRYTTTDANGTTEATHVYSWGSGQVVNGNPCLAVRRILSNGFETPACICASNCYLERPLLGVGHCEGNAEHWGEPGMEYTDSLFGGAASKTHRCTGVGCVARINNHYYDSSNTCLCETIAGQSCGIAGP